MHVGGGGALLRAVDGRRPVRAQQGVLHVVGRDQLHPRQVDEAGEVGVGDLLQGGTGGHERVTLPVVEDDAQGAEHPGAAVGGRAAAQGQHDPGRAVGQHGPDGLAEPDAAAGERGQLSGGQHLQPGGGGDLDHGGGAVEGHGGGGRFAGGAGDRHGHCLEPGTQSGGDAAVPAVGQGQGAHVDAWGLVAQSGGQGLGDLGGGQRPFELVRGDQDSRRGRGGGAHRRASPTSSLSRCQDGRAGVRWVSPAMV